jgi:hypothetical protein
LRIRRIVEACVAGVTAVPECYSEFDAALEGVALRLGIDAADGTHGDPWRGKLP